MLRIESAMGDLGKLKNAAERQVDAREHAATAALASCRTKGSGWKRLRGVRDRAQRKRAAARAHWGSATTTPSRRPARS